MIGDTLQDFHISWVEWQGGRDGHGHVRTCIGTVEHVGRRTILIRRPRGGLVVKRMTMATMDAGRLSARAVPDGYNELRRWWEHDEDADLAMKARFAAAKARHEAEAAAEDARYAAAQAQYATEVSAEYATEAAAKDARYTAASVAPQTDDFEFPF